MKLPTPLPLHAVRRRCFDASFVPLTAAFLAALVWPAIVPAAEPAPAPKLIVGMGARDLAAFERNVVRAKALGARFDDNEKKLTDLQAVLDAKGGNLGELFGVVRIVAGDVSSVIYNSLISAQYPKRELFVNELAQSKALPSIDKLEKLWFFDWLSRRQGFGPLTARTDLIPLYQPAVPSAKALDRVATALSTAALGSQAVLAVNRDAAR